MASFVRFSAIASEDLTAFITQLRAAMVFIAGSAAFSLSPGSLSANLGIAGRMGTGHGIYARATDLVFSARPSTRKATLRHAVHVSDRNATQRVFHDLVHHEQLIVAGERLQTAPVFSANMRPRYSVASLNHVEHGDLVGIACRL